MMENVRRHLHRRQRQPLTSRMFTIYYSHLVTFEAK